MRFWIFLLALFIQCPKAGATKPVPDAGPKPYVPVPRDPEHIDIWEDEGDDIASVALFETTKHARV